jgi:hypothetical protein
MRRVCTILLIGLLLAFALPVQAAVSTFEDLPLAPESFVNNSGGFKSGSAWFANRFTGSGGSVVWDGFSYSNMTLPEVEDGKYTAKSSGGGGANGSENYAVAFGTGSFGNPPIASLLYDLPSLLLPRSISGAYFTNTVHAYNAMNEDGDSKFGGISGNDPDWFKLNIIGLNFVSGILVTTGSVEFYLADFRFENGGEDYIVDDWTYVDLTSLGDVIALQFDLSSSDVGSMGMNTPAYFAMDDLDGGAPVPIPSALWLMISGIVGLVGLRRAKRGK